MLDLPSEPNDTNRNTAGPPHDEEIPLLSEAAAAFLQQRLARSVQPAPPVVADTKLLSYLLGDLSEEEAIALERQLTQSDVLRTQLSGALRQYEVVTSTDWETLHKEVNAATDIATEQSRLDLLRLYLDCLIRTLNDTLSRLLPPAPFALTRGEDNTVTAPPPIWQGEAVLYEPGRPPRTILLNGLVPLLLERDQESQATVLSTLLAPLELPGTDPYQLTVEIGTETFWQQVGTVILYEGQTSRQNTPLRFACPGLVPPAPLAIPFSLPPVLFRWNLTPIHNKS